MSIFLLPRFSLAVITCSSVPPYCCGDGMCDAGESGSSICEAAGETSDCHPLSGTCSVSPNPVHCTASDCSGVWHSSATYGSGNYSYDWILDFVSTSANDVSFSGTNYPIPAAGDSSQVTATLTIHDSNGDSVTPSCPTLTLLGPTAASGCTDDTQCESTPNTPYCKQNPAPGSCVQCFTNTHCEDAGLSGYICTNNQCVEDNSGLCIDDGDCDAGQTCENGACVSSTGGCTSNGDCPNGQTCTAGACITPGSGGTDTGGGATGVIPNPLSGINNLADLIAKLLTVFVKVLMPFIVIMFIISGLMFITARGNPAKLEVAKKALLYTTIGAAIVLGAWVFAQAIQATINQIAGN